VPLSVFPAERTALLLADVINLFNFPSGAVFAGRSFPAGRILRR
jgi:hypothetical protein